MRYLSILLFLCPVNLWAATWYVRTDGGKYGTSSSTCNGQTDAAFTGSNGPGCGVDHPFEILGTYTGDPLVTRISAGDTVIIKNGSYRMGYTSGVYDSGICYSDWTYTCYTDEIPSGVDANNKTKIYGEGWNSGCATKPELWGVGRADYMFNLDASSNVDMRCLDITDHDNCGVGDAGAPNACDESAPYTGHLHARRGVYAYNGSNNEFTDIDVHGMVYTGFMLGKQTALTMTDVNIIGNGHAGVDQDTPEADDSWSGSNVFTRVKINWNGCAENYPVDGGYNNCVDQNDAGYGDGWGSTDTAGDFTFTDVEFKYNTSDTLDLLYHTDGAAIVTVERGYFEGNVGNSLKFGGNQAIVRNTVVIANCGFFDQYGQTGTNFAVCRAGGNAIVMDVGDGDDFALVNNTIVGESDILVEIFGCDTGEDIQIKNNVFQGTTEWGGGDTTSWMFNYSGCDGTEVTATHNVIFDTQEVNPCTDPITQSNCYETDPNLTTFSFGPDSFDVIVTPTSDAINNGLAASTVVGNTTVPSDDYRALSRDANVDIGAYEYNASSPPPQATISGVTFSGATKQ